MAKKNFKGVPDDYAEQPPFPWDYIPPPSTHYVGQPKTVLNSVYGGALAPHNSTTKALSEIEFLIAQGIMTVEEATSKFGIPYKKPNDPVLIKAKGPKVMWNDNPHVFTEPVSMNLIRIEVRPDIPGYMGKKHGFACVVSAWQDTTESQLRKLLMDGFIKITDDIIKNMKEQNK